MKHPIILLIAITLILGCSNPIKNEDAQVTVEEGANPERSTPANQEEHAVKNTPVEEEEPSAAVTNQVIEPYVRDSTARSYWVGFFNPHEDVSLKGKYVNPDDGLYWGRRNKISISIDYLEGDSVIGHSVVAGNHRPFQGKAISTDNGKEFIVSEPGDDKYDGKFTFKITGDRLIGIWDAFGKIDIPKREYTLTEKSFLYNPDIDLERSRPYANWDKFIESETIQVFDEGTPDEEVYEWIRKEFSASTEKAFEINASNTVLTKEVVENLTSSDLVLIRNTIYARHGYSFKNRPLRVFFDAQAWYIPVHADITQAFTDIELKNIELLLRYEKNAKEFYDTFGRG